jgi:PPOX class probable F420-dependent enzyme
MVMADLDLVRRLSKQEHGLAVIATTRADGSVQASVANAGVLDDPVTGRPTVALVVGGNTLKIRLLRARPQATVVFRSGWEWVAVDGPVRIAGPDDALEGVAPTQIPRLLRDVFTAAGGTHDNWDEYDRVMAAERRAAVLVEPARITSNG